MDWARRTAYVGIVGLALLATGCRHPEIRYRMGSIPTQAIGSHFPNPKKLGRHNSNEEGGQIYTTRGGLIDLDHLRECADFTRVFSKESYKNIIENKQEFLMWMREPSLYHIKLTYPHNWKEITSPKKEAIAKDVSIDLGAYAAHVGGTWHEILTWFGWNSTIIISEYNSAFSCEDPSSNALGIYLAQKVLRGKNPDFDKGLTYALNEELAKLETRSIEEAKKRASFMPPNKRHFDIGQDDGLVTPWIPRPANETISPISYPVPNLESLEKYGFTLEFEIEPRELEGNKILRTAGKEKIINPRKDFPTLIRHIKDSAIKKYGPDVDNPILK